MNPLTAEWVAKAEDDYAGAVALNRRRKHPLPDLVCFHCQQTAEKYLKAFLQEMGIAFPKTHILVDLLQLAIPVDAGLQKLSSFLLVLEDYAVKFRYPGLSTTPTQAKAALQAARTFRTALRRRLGLIPARTRKQTRKTP